MPPLVRAPGQRSLISGSASMNAFANSLCSSIPVATARTFGSKTMSSGAKPASSIEQPVRALADLDLALDGVGLALARRRPSRRPRRRSGGSCRACSRNGSSPSLSEIELTIPLPWRHSSPAASTDQRELSTMIGSRAASGSVARRLRKRPHRLLAVEQVGVHVHVERVRAVPHLLERDRDGLLEVAGLDERAEARRAGDVRPLADHHEAGVGPDLERLEPAPAGRGARARGPSAAGSPRRRRRSGGRARASCRSSRRRR